MPRAFIPWHLLTLFLRGAFVTFYPTSIQEKIQIGLRFSAIHLISLYKSAPISISTFSFA